MAIDLRITADTPEELISTINGLASLGAGRVSRAAPAVEREEPEEREEAPLKPEPQADETTRPTTRRTRQPKANTATDGAPTADAEPDTSASAGPASEDSAKTTSGATGEKSAPAGDVFGEQIKQANAEAVAERALEAAEKAAAPATPAAAPAGEITMETINATFAPMIGAGKKFPSMREAQEFLKAHFKNADGQPARGMREVQPADYGRLMQLLQA